MNTEKQQVYVKRYFMLLVLIQHNTRQGAGREAMKADFLAHSENPEKTDIQD